jgi:hypothetical protein
LEDYLMADPTIDQAFVQQFHDVLVSKFQQEGSVLERAVSVQRGIVGDSDYVDILAAATAAQIQSRHTDTNYTFQTHTRRKLTTIPFEVADLIDRPDKLKMLIDPASDYIRNFSWSLGVAADNAIIAAARGNAYEGVAGATPVALPAGQKIAHGSASLTLGKVITAKTKLDKANVSPRVPRYFIYYPDQLAYLLENVTEIKNSQYVDSVRAMMDGVVTRFMGFEWIGCNLLPKPGSYRYNLAWAEPAMKLGWSQEIMTRVDELPTKHYSTQAWAFAQFGATRVLDEGVVEIECTET